MNPEQFVFWLSGYITNCRNNFLEINMKDLTDVLNKVKINSSPLVMFCQTTEE